MSTEVVRSDTIDLLVSALMVLGLSPDPKKPLPTGEQCVTHIADGVGRDLAEANLDAVSLSEGSNPPEAAYRWRPVMEVALRYTLSPAVAVQVEAARRHVVRNCAAHPGWEHSQARQIAARLGESLRRGPLQHWPRETHGDFRGIAACTPGWTREDGFPTLQSRADA
ncbi:hypothetical protein G3N18_01920 [Microbacterium sp. 2C]|uniref:hypothetical protein n=1 Tax=Microbacterium paulum TaxID=2707006 RepID=UPI0018C28C99|nr:hypothetical protein [Microbacterium paulum]MBG0716844.1 hypothetical protein [Microbacterium paulum]